MLFRYCIRKSLLFCGTLPLIALVFCAFNAMAAPVTIRLQNDAVFAGGIYSGAEDTYLSQAYPEASAGKVESTVVGFTTSGNGGKSRAFVRYKLSVLKSGFAVNTVFAAVRLKMYLSSAGGAVFTGKKVYLYRIMPSNKGWAAGIATSNTVPEAGAACWKWLSYDNTNFAPNDAVNCPNPGAGCPRRFPWSGDTASYKAAWPNLTTYTGTGCGVVNKDYYSTAVAEAIVSSTDAGKWITFTFNDISFLNSWVNSDADNSGFMISCPDLEALSKATYSYLQFASCEAASKETRPVLECDIENYNPSAAFTYNLSRDSKVSIAITNSNGTVVKELLFAAPRSAGNSVEFWDCKDDPCVKSDIARVVPNGTYTAKILATQGLQAEYLMQIGTTGDPWRSMPGNHVTPGSVAVDTSGIVIAGAISECDVGITKIKRDGSFVWQRPWNWEAWQGAMSMALYNGNIYASQWNGAIKVFSASNPNASAAQYTWNVAMDPRSSAEAGRPFIPDIAIRKGLLAVSEHFAGKLLLLNAVNGTRLDTIDVPAIDGVAMDTAGNILAIVGNTVRKYTISSNTIVTSYVTLIGSNLNTPHRIDVNPHSNEIYISEGIPEQVTDSGTFNWRPYTWQVKKFSPTGALLATFGKAGGYKCEGRWNPAQTAFFQVNDLTAASDGSFFVAEYCSPTRRVAQYDSSGTFIKEWFCGAIYAPQGAVDPVDPRIVWIDNNYVGYLMRAKADYVNKTWQVLGFYKTDKVGIGGTTAISSRFNVMRRNNMTYLYRDYSGTILVFDESGDSLRPISFTGENGQANATRTWTDLNGNGDTSANEFTNGHKGNFWWSRSCVNPPSSAMDSNFVFYPTWSHWSLETDAAMFGGWSHGPLRMKPASIKTVNGVAVPLYEMDSLKGNYFDTMPEVPSWVGPAGNMLGSDGSLFSILNYACNFNFVQSSDTFGSPNWLGGCAVIKYNAAGKIQWKVGRHSGQSTPNPGEVCSFQRGLGVAQGCVFAADYHPYQYVWDQDGLWVGRLLDNKYPSSPGLNNPETWNLCGEQFAGVVTEVPSDTIPGLSKGDVLFFGAGANAVIVYRIHGFDQFERKTVSFTVNNGQIMATSVYGPAFRDLEKASSIIKISVQQKRASILYSVAEPGMVQLDLYSVLGRKITSIEKGFKKAGVYRSELNHDRTVPGGLYIVRLTSGGRQFTRHMLLVK